MIFCQYCGSSYEAFQPTCTACGAPLRDSQERVNKKPQAEIIEEIRLLCHQNIILFKVGVFFDGESIPEKKLAIAKKSFNVFPNGKRIFFYCDTTALNNGKQGFMICEDGVYWQNSWVKSTSRNFLPWNKFKERVIVLKHYDLSLGMGDSISLAGIGRKVLFPTIEKLFHRIQNILKENS